ncbi:MAG: diaminopimelate decarboxylase [Prevotella sp.]|jgi:diaminopimelate decarboxylase|nr:MULTISPECIES: diaminopimelate decarboxylase [unclassified Prevotella]MCH3969253.1 diaminopimelate decarboxylase [Prevotella sp.]MCH3985404.1 diaminopimelate decarboxylase [Prevotella sp.]MCH3991897.1 diaminopimelate decarboxylase [Prevotella sp.]MCH4017536.1 diaminopimelate decarboxylase [Prevotella sp.]MCH4185719.1 diaminopimelate decarboxylase [Prevotella sp.]
MKGKFPIDKFTKVDTPFYYYDTDLLKKTLSAIKTEEAKHKGFTEHYAVKANANPKILKIICQAGLGADCVSGGEIKRCIETGFLPSKIVFAGVGKSDREINFALDKDIFSFNVESIPELEVINALAAQKGKIARIAFRINPDIDAHTHANITTGLAENKFGIAMRDMIPAIEEALKMKNVHFIGLHFHIGSQILDMGNFKALCHRINDLQDQLEDRHIPIQNINVGGGLGVDYVHPNQVPVPNFKAYFDTYAQYLKLRPGQTLHFELGRAVVAQMGSLITRILYVKQGVAKQFAIVDAGMTDLIRPALYDAYHRIENLSSDLPEQPYDVVGPICESSDVFAKSIQLNRCHRGDLIAIRSAGAYGEVMASQYNCRPLPKSYMKEDF